MVEHNGHFFDGLSKWSGPFLEPSVQGLRGNLVGRHRNGQYFNGATNRICLVLDYSLLRLCSHQARPRCTRCTSSSSWSLTARMRNCLSQKLVGKHR